MADKTIHELPQASELTGEELVLLEQGAEAKKASSGAFIAKVAEEITNASGFQEQLNESVAEYFDNDPPFFELPSGGQSGQALLSDGEDGAVWGEIKSGSGLTDAIKTALLACFDKVAWIDQNGQTYYDALSDALYAEDEGGGGDTSDYTDSAAWNLNKTIVYPYQGKGYLEAMSDLDARMVTKTTKTLDSGSYYRISCASPYALYMIFCNTTDVCQAAVPTQGRTTNQVFLVSGYNKMGVVVVTPSTATTADPRNAAVTLAKEKKQTRLRWSLNMAVYTERTDQPFDEIQAPVDARMLLTRFIPLESGKTYQFRCNSPYAMYLLLLDENNVYKKMEGSSTKPTQIVSFTNSAGYAKANITVITPATATQADVSAIEIYVV